MAEKEKYRPSNGTEGEWFMERWCYKCAKECYPDDDDDPNACDIILYSMTYEEEDEEYPKELVLDEKGNPQCTAFERKTT